VGNAEKGAAPGKLHLFPIFTPGELLKGGRRRVGGADPELGAGRRKTEKGEDRYNSDVHGWKEAVQLYYRFPLHYTRFAGPAAIFLTGRVNPEV
jgi:hypothetical protein